MIAELALLLPLAAAAAADAGHGKHEDSPLGLAVWTTITFTIVLGVLWKFAWGPIQEQLERRENTIRDAIEGAERERAEAEHARKEREKALQSVEAEADDIRTEARDEAKRIRDEGREAGEKARKDQVDAASRDIDAARNDALEDVQGAATELAMTIASRVVGKSIQSKEHQALIDECIREIESAGGKA